MYGGGRDAALRFVSILLNLSKLKTLLNLKTQNSLEPQSILFLGASSLAEVTLSQTLSGRKLETLVMVITGRQLFRLS